MSKMYNSHHESDNFQVRLLDSGSGAVLAESTPRQPPLYAPEESRDDVPYSFNAYAAPGTVQVGSLRSVLNKSNLSDCLMSNKCV